ncbi:unnamed protein product [Sphagnum jensenii]|uniref:Uncharacterized protein n=1 Tax=Sphagnum jensenii TaxID=128206 RepID=A0ABP1AHP6_9BRYO
MAEEKAMVTMMQQMKTSSQALQQKNLKLTHAHRVTPGHLPEVDQSKWDGKLAKRVVDLGILGLGPPKQYIIVPVSSNSSIWLKSWWHHPFC